MRVFGVFVVLWQLPRYAQRPTTRHDGDFVYRIGVRQELSYNRMTRFVIRSGAALLFTHDGGAAFWAHEDFVFGIFKVLHFDQTFVATCGEQRGFVDQVGQIRAGEAWGATCDHGHINVLGDRYFAHVDV